jgi:tetratricopeptide (TPR) repeat protein
VDKEKNEEPDEESPRESGQKSPIHRSDFLTECLEPLFKEETETRNILNTPSVKIIADLGNNGKFRETIQKAEELLQEYSDFDYLYFWKGIAHMGLGDYSSAQSILKKGLEKAKSKSYLCLKLGVAAKESKDAQQALKWWCQSIHCHESNPHDLDNTPYLYLAAIAGAYGLKKEHDAFQTKAFRIKSASLSFEAMSDLQNLFVDQKTEAMVDVIKEMSNQYF